MKEKYRYLLVAALCAVILCACDKEDSEPAAIGDSPTFTATIEGADSRAYDTTWEDNDAIGISITSGSVTGGNVSGGGATNLSFTHQGNGNFAVTDPTKQITFKDDNRVSFKAYYPYRSNRPSSGTITSISCTNQTNQKSFDFLWAEGEGSKTDYKVNLTFAHKMCKLTFVFKSDSGMDLKAITSFKLTGVTLTGGRFDTNTGVCSASKSTSSSATTVTPNNIIIDDDGEKAVTSFIICPQELNSISVPFTIVDKTAYNYLCNLPFSSAKIEAGKNYQFLINLSQLGATVNKCTITNWTLTDLGDEWEAW